MTYRIPLPAGGRLAELDIIEPNSTAVQRFIRREGLGAYEPPTAAAVLALCELAGDGFTMFDVGANMGLYGSMAAAMFDPSAVHLFEPAPESARVASEIVRRNDLAAEVFPAAAGDVTGRGSLQLSPVSDASNSMVEGFRDAIGTVEVDTITLDDHVARTGVVPDIVKIDVETFEPAVLRGAARTIGTHRPAIVVEVLRRRGTDHGVELTELMAPHGYHYYELSAAPTWEASPALRGSGTTDRDWLMTPERLDDRFPDRWEHWRRALAECGVDANPRVPIVSSVRAAWRRGGPTEVVATAKRYLDSARRRIRP